MMRCHRYFGTLLFLLILVSLTGCAKYKAKSAFNEAEDLARAEQYDQAVEQYFAAAELNPGNMTYKLKLTASRTRAAAYHIRKARVLAKEDKLQDALAEYRLARGFDQSLEVAALEEKQVKNLLEARTLVEEGYIKYEEKRYPDARRIVNEVLQLDPENTRGLELQDKLDERRQAVVLDGIELDIASDEPITLRFRQTNVREAFNVLGQLSGINFILDEDVKGKAITVLLEKGTFAQALELVLQMGGVEKKVLNSKTIIIYPNTKDKGKQYQDQVIQTFYLSHIEAKKAINMLRTMLQLRKVYVHEERNALVIRDTPDTVRLAEQIIKAADRADSEVLFDVEVVAVREGDTLNLGPSLSAYSTSVGFSKDGQNIINDTLGPGSSTDGLIKSLNNLQTFYTLPTAVFDLAKTLSSTEILASPKIRVKNNEKAKIHIGNRDPVVTTTSNANNDQVSQTVQYVDSGIKLDIEPTVQLDGTVLAKITLEVSNAQRLNANDTTGQSPVALTTTNAQTALVLVDGVRTILGGLYETNASKNKSTIPFLGDIPIIGSLLTNFDNSETKREILLSITPYVVKRVEVPEPAVATIWSGGEDTLMNGPKFGAFSQPLLSEVEATKPGAAPAMQKPVSSRRIAYAGPTQHTDIQPSVLVPGEAGIAQPVPAAEPSATVPEVALAPVEPAVAEPAPTQPEMGAPEAEPASQAGPATATATMAALPTAKPALSFAGPPAAAVGSEFTLNVQVGSISQLYSAPLFVNFDASRLEFVGAKEGTFLGQGGQRTVFSVSPNPATGQVVIGYKLAQPGGGVSGNGPLFSLTFRAKSPGPAHLELNRLNFHDAAGTRLDVAPASTVISIQ